METTVYILLAILMGAAISIYMPMNSTVGKLTGSPLVANVAFYSIGLLASILLIGFFGDFKSMLKLRNIPPFLLLAGIMSAFMVLGTIFLIPKFGARKVFLLQISGQIIMALLISHFGMLASPKDPLTWQKLVGAGLLILGAIISIM
jgi:transporter family-2 protein